MKMLHSMTQHLNNWRRSASACALKKTIDGASVVSEPAINLLQKKFSALLRSANCSQRQPKRHSSTCARSRNSPKVVFVVAVASLTSVLGYRFYNQPKLVVGTVAPQTIWAPEDATVEDTKTTEAKRKAVRRNLAPALMVDREVDGKIYQQLQQSIDKINSLRQLLAPFPFTNTSTLSISTQLYLLETPEWQWRTVLANLDAHRTTDELFSTPAVAPSSPSAELQRAITELQAYQRTAYSANLSALIDQITQARQRYQKALSVLSQECKDEGIGSRVSRATGVYVRSAMLSNALDTPDCGYAAFLAASQSDWQKTQTGIRNAAELILTQGIPPGLPPSHLQETASIQVQNQVPQSLQSSATALLVSLLQPNLKQDAAQTKLLAEQAVQAVPPEIIQVRRGEIVVRAGEVITQPDFLLLDYFNLSRRGLNWLGLIGFAGVTCLGVSAFWLVQRRFHPGMRRRDYIMVLLLTLSTPLIVSLGWHYTSLPAIGLLMGSFYGSALGVTTVGLIALFLPVSLPISWEHLLADAVGGLLGGLMAGRMRSREELALLGVAVGLAEGAVYLLLNLTLGAASGLLWYAFIPKAALYSLTGLAWSVVALGLSPYLEHLFDLVTSIRLSELANPNRPLLKRLAEEAPGTFQHTLLVATLAEAAAKVLGCNVELVRTGTLYHDVGKLHDPQGFIENQIGHPNKHDEINDPWKSAEIIKKHVTEGLAMARKYRLPKAICAFIPEHQGTMLIAYFHHKAQQESSEPIPENDFRYDGPIPQSRETGIVMLADSCEAALRSLKDATYDEALVMVNKILKARWQDNQLLDSGLRRDEMPLIAEIFVQVWQQFHHKRIAYPKIGVKT
ncbi:HD family phosphohydrolase [Microseira wollei]|nr:HDIG domain-containing metalloprotein [Microseira wollei]